MTDQTDSSPEIPDLFAFARKPNGGGRGDNMPGVVQQDFREIFVILDRIEAGSMMSAGAGLHRHMAPGQFGKKGQNLFPSQLAAEQDSPGRTCAVRLERSAAH